LNEIYLYDTTVFTPLQGFKGIGDTYIRETYTGFKPVSLFSLSLLYVSIIDRYHGSTTLSKENNKVKMIIGVETM
jgi:hypothetical protein